MAVGESPRRHKGQIPLEAALMHRIRCAHCGGSHRSVEAVRECAWDSSEAGARDRYESFMESLAEDRALERRGY